MRHDLTQRECEILVLIAGGLSDRQIARHLRLSPDTVHAHRDHLFLKTGCQNRVELTRWGIARGLVPTNWAKSEQQDDA